MSTYVGEGTDVSSGREFLALMKAAADAALAPARALVDASRARPIAVNLSNAFRAVGTLFESVVDTRRRLEADTATRPNVLRQQWQEFTDAAVEDGAATRRTIATGVDELTAALKQEALPVSDDPARTLVARQEVELALRAHPGLLPFQVLLAQASRGLDIAAAAASEWGRLTLRAATPSNDETGFDSVVDAAIETALTGPDEAQRRAAAALQATRTPAPGRNAAALYEAQVLAGAVIGRVGQIAKRGILIP
jgi:hypothetical protein